jgi:DNA-binding NarL/FixJ family response regulator
VSAPLRVLLVDDHALVRAAIRQALTTSDVTVVADAKSAEEALQLAPLLRPDVMLIDIDLPGMSGLHLLRELAPRLPDTRFVMLTVSTDQRDVLEALRLGAMGYLTKDLDPAALLRAVRGVRQGDLTMSRRIAARLVRDLVRGTSGAGHRMEHGSHDLASLSSREHEVLRLLAEGLTDRDIGGALGISIRTVESHVSAILRKLDARNRAEAARRYLATMLAER